MTEHKVCEGCKFNHYPECYGMKMFDGKYMNIENLKPLFECGKKNETEIDDFSLKQKTEEQLKIEELETRITELEKK